MPEFILNNHLNILNINQAAFSLEPEFTVIINLNGENNLITEARNIINNEYDGLLNRAHIIDMINNQVTINGTPVGIKTIILYILCWGGYFRAIRTNQTKINMLEFLINENEGHFLNIKNVILNTNIQDVNSVRNLFDKFRFRFRFRFKKGNNLYFPGLGYAFYTKLFFFFSQDNKLPILDKWTLLSFRYLTNITPELNHIYNQIGITGKYNLRDNQNQSMIYFHYVNKMNEWVNALNTQFNTQDYTITKLETFLFGHNLRLKVPNNPRLVYKKKFNL